METFDLLDFRPFAPPDMELVRRWRNSPAVAEYMMSDRVISPEEHEKWFMRMIEDPRQRYWVVSYLGKDAGVMYVYNIDSENSRCYVGDYIGEPSLQRHKGIGAFIAYAFVAYGFDVLNSHKICGEVLSSNPNSLKLHMRFGFKNEGVLREQIRKGDRWDDLVLLGLLRSEWEVIQPEWKERLQQLATRLREREAR